ncbi:hypothetical protein ACWDSJ_05640 [Nocardia sp. NPDC003482]
MRSVLRRRPTETVVQSPTTTTDPTVDPPIVATLVRPLLQLRASLGTGRAAPDETIAAALSNSSAQAADTEAPHREGVHAVESTWVGAGADAAVPALRTTQTQIGDISDRGPAYLAVLSDAHATSARAAQQVDRIIADFRRDARTILGNATAAPDTDAVITRATQALRDAISAVQSARTEMDGHSQRLSDMGPLTVTQPAGLSDSSSPSPTYTTPSTYSDGGTGYEYDTPQYGAAPNRVPLDPAQAAQLQLQQQLIQAGVQVGTAAINAGVDIGTHLIDKIAEVGTHAMDTVAASVDKVVDKAVPELIHPGSTTNGDSSTGAASSSSDGGSKVFDFGGTGGGASSGQSTPSTANPGAVLPVSPTPPQSQPAGPKPVPAPDPEPAAPPPAAASEPAPAPMPNPDPPVAAPAPVSPDSGQPGQSGQPGVTGGLAMPPSTGNDSEHKPRGDGQLGVTVPANVAEEMVPAAVIGDFGDDTI